MDPIPDEETPPTAGVRRIILEVRAAADKAGQVVKTREGASILDTFERLFPGRLRALCLDHGDTYEGMPVTEMLKLLEVNGFELIMCWPGPDDIYVAARRRDCTLLVFSVNDGKLMSLRGAYQSDTLDSSGWETYTTLGWSQDWSVRRREHVTLGTEAFFSRLALRRNRHVSRLWKSPINEHLSFAIADSVYGLPHEDRARDICGMIAGEWRDIFDLDKKMTFDVLLAMRDQGLVAINTKWDYTRDRGSAVT